MRLRRRARLSASAARTPAPIAKPICPNARAVPRFTAPSAPASAPATTNAPSIVSSLASPSGSDILPSSAATSAASSSAGSCSASQPLRRAPPAERAQAALAVLDGEVRQRPRAPRAQAPARELGAAVARSARCQCSPSCRSSSSIPVGGGSEETASTARRAPAERAQRRAQVAPRADRDLAEVGLGHDQHVRDLHDPRLQELQHVAAARLHHHDDGVGDLRDLGLRLADARPSRSPPRRTPPPAPAPRRACPTRGRPAARRRRSSG